MCNVSVICFTLSTRRATKTPPWGIKIRMIPRNTVTKCPFLEKYTVHSWTLSMEVFGVLDTLLADKWWRYHETWTRIVATLTT